MEKPFSGLDLRSPRSVGQRILLESGIAGDTGTPEVPYLFRASVSRLVHGPKKIFVAHLPRAKCGPRLQIPDAPDASSQMVTARWVVPRRDGSRNCCGNATLRLSTRSNRLRRAKNVGASRFECPLVAVNGSRTGSRDQGSRAFCVFTRSREAAKITLRFIHDNARLPRPPRRHGTD